MNRFFKLKFNDSCQLLNAIFLSWPDKKKPQFDEISRTNLLNQLHLKSSGLFKQITIQQKL